MLYIRRYVISNAKPIPSFEAMEKKNIKYLISSDVVTNDIIGEKRWSSNFRIQNSFFFYHQPLKIRTKQLLRWVLFQNIILMTEKISRSSYSYTFLHPINKLHQDIKTVGFCNGLVQIYDFNFVYVIILVTKKASDTLFKIVATFSNPISM